MFGLLILVIGLLMLFEKLGWIPGNFWDFVWPAVFIIFGLSIMMKKKRWSDCCKPKKKEVVDEQ